MFLRINNRRNIILSVIFMLMSVQSWHRASSRATTSSTTSAGFVSRALISEYGFTPVRSSSSEEEIRIGRISWAPFRPEEKLSQHLQQDSERNQHNRVWSDCGLKSDHVHINSVVLAPSEPQRGKDLHVVINATVSKTITGGTIQLKIKDGFFPVHKSFDICEIDPKKHPCPIQKGFLIIDETKTVPELAMVSFKFVNRDFEFKCALRKLNLELAHFFICFRDTLPSMGWVQIRMVNSWDVLTWMFTCEEISTSAVI